MNLADPMMKPESKARIEQLMSFMGSWIMKRAQRKISQRRHKDSDVRRDSHITAELGAKGTAEAFGKAADYSDDWTCFTCASNAVLSARKVEVRRGRDWC